MVTAWLIGLGEEENDQDYHLILCSLNIKDSMIAEIPDPTCKKLENFIGLRERYTAAHDFITTEIDETPGDIHYLPAPVKVRVTGFLFFDKMAHGNGHARNGGGDTSGVEDMEGGLVCLLLTISRRYEFCSCQPTNGFLIITELVKLNISIHFDCIFY